MEKVETLPGRCHFLDTSPIYWRRHIHLVWHPDSYLHDRIHRQWKTSEQSQAFHRKMGGPRLRLANVCHCLVRNYDQRGCTT